MSSTWEAYIDELLYSGHITTAAILGQDGPTLWAASDGFDFDSNTVNTLIGACQDGSEIKGGGGGVYLGNRQYYILQSGAGRVLGKHGWHGLVMERTQEAAVLGIYDGSCQPGEALLAVERLAKFMVEQGY